MDSVDKYGSCGIPWFEGEILTPSSAEEQLKKLREAFLPVVQTIIDQLVPVIIEAFDSITRIFSKIHDGLKQLCDDITLLESYSDKRIVWLALHHKKAKVRKKNTKRILKELLKAVKRDDHD